MTHIEIPLPDGTHLTVAHFRRRLTQEQGENVLRGLEKFAEPAKDFQFYWGAHEFMGPRKDKYARFVEDANGVYTEVRQKLVEGLRYFDIYESTNFGPYTPHVTKADPKPAVWALMPFRPCWALVQKPHRIEVPFAKAS